ncbi:MAG: DUF494 domain-containing protein [Gammaproteobacteria bacterium]|nr:DUF494 domain-containing protein [Gammaproteobacteria bacterium]NNC96626.1 DUF494 domain-containing protein [Gammaproteobacteria bacterium]NNM14547.1 DUF494 domain-containing protein [Gammaproteobacteria bacterium]
MRQNVLDVLIYLFETYSDENSSHPPERNDLEDELSRAGFSDAEIDRALGWIDELTLQWSYDRSPKTTEVKQAPGSRIFTQDEQVLIPSHCRGYIYYLEQIGILDEEQRERVIDRIIALETDDLDVESLQWVVLMVLFSQPDQEKAFQNMETLIDRENAGLVH